MTGPIPRLEVESPRGMVPALRRQLEYRPHAAVAALPIAPSDSAELAEIIARIGAELGPVVPPAREPAAAPEAGAVGRLRPRDDRTIGGRAITEALHTDGADRVRPPRYTLLLCEQPDERGGGVSMICDREAFGACAKSVAGATELLTTPLPWKIALEDGGGVLEEPALGTRGTVRWLDPDIAVDLAAVPQAGWVLQTSRRLAGALDAWPGVCAALLERNDLLVIDNHRCLHARSAIVDPVRSHRSMLRTRVAAH